MPSRVDQRWISRSDSGSDSGYSEGSYHTQSTALTVDSRRPSLRDHKIVTSPYIEYSWTDLKSNVDVNPRASVETYASTVASSEDFDEDLEPFDVPEEEDEVLETTAIPSTPHEFAEYFPSTRRLNIKHDDSTLDGNMNLRVDTEVPGSDGYCANLTLFHLRMHDLKNREFSLRRYCRDSGREVCHSSRKYTQPAAVRRPGLQRSMSNALSTFRFKSDTKTVTATRLKRQDSGYQSCSDDDGDMEAARNSFKGHNSIPLPTNTTRLEFSNYAHIDIKRRGAKTSKRYEFEYWGTTYTWKRVTRRTSSAKEIAYHLVDTETSHPIAHIVPAPLTVAEAREEDAKGGWVPPCSLWISDARVLTGLTDVAE